MIELPYKLILASGSPRRKQLLEEAGFHFTIEKTDAEEAFPPHLKREEVARYLAMYKSEQFRELSPDELLITADTIVCLEDDILNKPSDYKEAFSMLNKLSGRKHEVITAVCFRTSVINTTIHVITSVYFKPLSAEEIDYYIRHFEPYDKAGGYGIQEWIGLIGITRIEGSYFNVVGLPVKEVYEILKSF